MLGWLVLAFLAAFAPQAKPAADAQAVVSGALVDADYAFTLATPSADWSLLREVEVSQVHSDGLAGLSNGSLRGYVLLRRVPKTTLEDAQNWLMELVPIEDRTVTKRELGTFAGQKALLALGLGDLHGARVRFRLSAFLSKGYAYLLLAYGPSEKVGADAKELQPFFDAFKLGAAAPKSRAYAPLETNSSGAGWAMEGGTYMSPQIGVRIAVPAGWRTLTPGNSSLGSELLGFASREPEVLVQLSAEAVDASLEKQWGEAAAARFSTALDPTVPATLKPTALPLAGVNLQARWYRHRMDPLHHYLVGTGSKDGLSYRMSMCALIGEEEKALKPVRALLGAVQPLPPLRRAESALEMLARGEESQARIGKDGFLRAGRYKDLSAGFLIDLPSGFWTTEVATNQKLLDKPFRLLFRDDVRGLEGYLYVYEDATEEIKVSSNGGPPKTKRRTARWWSERVIDALIGDEPDEDDDITDRRSLNTKEESIAAGEWKLYAMSATYKDSGFPKRVLTAGALRNNTLVVLVVRGLAPAVQQAAPSFRRAAASFRWLSEKRGARYVKDGRFHDDQLGISLQLDAKEWNWVPDEKEERSEGYLCEIKGPKLEIVLFEVSSAVALPSAESLARRFKTRYGDDFGKLDWSKAAERDEQIQDAPAHVYDYVGAEARIEISIVRANGLQYGVAFVRRGAGSAAADEFAAFKRELVFTRPGGEVAERAASDAEAEAEAEKGAEPTAGDATKDPANDTPKDPAKVASKDAGKSAAKPSADKNKPAVAEPPADPKAPPHPLLLASGWREVSIRDSLAGFDLLIAFRAQPSWLEQLLASKTLDARGADMRPQFAAVRPAGTADGSCDLLAVERFALNAKTATPADAAAAITALVEKAQGRAPSTRTLDKGRLGPITVVAWREPPAKPNKDANAAAKPKPGAAQALAPVPGDATGGADDDARYTCVYLLTSNSRGWSVTVRTRNALNDEDSSALDQAIADYEPLP